MGIIQNIINTGGRIVQTVTRPPVQVIGHTIGTGTRIIGQAAAPIVRQGYQMAAQVPRVISRPPVQVIAPAVARIAAPAVRQVVRTAAPALQQTARMVQQNPALRSPNALPAQLGFQIARVAAPTVRRVAQQAPRVVQQAPRIVQRAPQMIQQGFNTGSRMIQRTPLAPINTAGQYAGNIIRARQLPNRQQVMNAGANIMRQTPLAPVVQMGYQYQRQGGVQRTMNQASRVIQRTPLAPINTAGQYAGNIIRARQLPNRQQVMNAGANIMRQTPLAPVVNAGQQARQTIVRNGGMQAAINRGSALFQRTPLAAFNTAGQYAGNVIRAGRAPTTQQVFNAGANIMRQTPLAPVVNAGQQARQTINRNGGVQAAINRGSDLFQRTPLAAVNTAGRYAGDVLRSGRLPSTQQVFNAGATIMRQTPLAPVVNAGQQARQTIVRNGGMQAAINRGSDIFQRTPFAAANTLGRYTGDVLRSGRLPSTRQFVSGAGTIAGQLNPVPRASGRNIVPMGNLTAPAQDWIGRVEGRNQTINQMQADAKAKGWWKNGMVAPPATSEGLTFLNNYQTAIDSMKSEYDTGAGTFLFSNNSTFKPQYVKQNQTAAQPTAPANQSAIRDPRDGSTDVLGKLGRLDVIGALGAGGKWIETNTIPWAEGVPTWLANGPANYFNTRVAGPLERGELSIPRAYDNWLMERHQKQLARLGPEPAKDSPNHLAWQMTRAQMGDGTAGSFRGLGGWSRDIFGGLVIGGAAAAATTIGFLAKGAVGVGGKLYKGDVVGAGSDVVTGGANAAIGTGTWIAGWPGRYAANPRAAPWEIAGEWYGGGAPLKGVGVAGRGLGKAASPLGQATGIVRSKTFGYEHIPYKSPGAILESFFDYSDPNLHGLTRGTAKPSIKYEWEPGKILPSRYMKIRDPGEIGDVGTGGYRGAFAAVGSQHLSPFGRYFHTKSKGISGRLLGSRAYELGDVPKVRVEPQQAAAIRHSIDSTGQFMEHYPRILEQADRQSKAMGGKPVAVPTPKQAKGFLEAENEVFLVFGEKAGTRIRTQFAGFAPGGWTPVKRVAFGDDLFTSTRRGNIAENIRYNWDVGRSGLRVYNRNYLRFMADDMNTRYGQEFGTRLMYPGEYGQHGRTTHLEPVAAGLGELWRTNPALRASGSAYEYQTLGRFHDIAKIGERETQPLPHAFAAAEAIRQGLFAPPEIAALSPAQRTTLARRIELHTVIDPRLYTWRGVKTHLIYRPDIGAKALANVDRQALGRFGVQVRQNRLFGLNVTGVDQGRRGDPVAAFGMGWFRPQSFGLGPARSAAGSPRRGSRATPTRTTSPDAEPWSRSPLDAMSGRAGRSPGHAYRSRRTGASDYPVRAPLGTGTYPAGTDAVYRAIAPASDLLSYGARKSGKGSGYRTRYRSDKRYGKTYTPGKLLRYPGAPAQEYPGQTRHRGGYPTRYSLDYQPPTPTYQPPYTPKYSPPSTPTYPPTYQPPTPPTYPPTYQPPTPPTYPPTYRPPTPPTYPPTYRPPTPPTYPPPYPPKQPPPYVPPTPPYEPPIPPYEPPYEPPTPPFEPPQRPNDTPDGRQGRPNGGMFAFDFGEKLGVYSPERMFSKRTKKDRIFGMTYTRRKKKAKSFLG